MTDRSRRNDSFDVYRTSEHASLIVCPACSYGFPETVPAGELTCPRLECGHRWLARAGGPIEGAACPELQTPGATGPISLEIPEGMTTLTPNDESVPLAFDVPPDPSAPVRFVRNGDRVQVVNPGSSKALQVNGRPIAGSQVLTARDRLSVHGRTLRFAVYFGLPNAERDLKDLLPLLLGGEPRYPRVGQQLTGIIALQREATTLGSAEECDAVLGDPLVSARHARIERRLGEYVLKDLRSEYGTFLNGKGVQRWRLQAGDLVQVGGYVFHFKDSQLVWLRQAPGVTVAAAGLSHQAGSVRILDRVLLVARPGEFIGLLGPSGAGKSSLLNALSGVRPAASGQVYVNGEPMYRSYDRLRHLIGYVPQQDIVHAELTCRQALFYVGRLRLPSTPARQLNARVRETLEQVGLDDRADTLIACLSGGQRKRVSVGIELLSRPQVLFLDEPASGLDPATASRLMRLFRRIARQGCPVLCTTHLMQGVNLFDKIAVLAPGGRLAFFGRPTEAKRYFDVRRFADVYGCLERQPAVDLQARFTQTPQHGQLQALVAAERAPAAFSRPNRLEPAPRVAKLQQWFTLSRRFVTILRGDLRSVALMLALPPLLSALTCLVFREQATVLFLLVISALWLGTSLAAQQIVKERSIYRRERMVVVQIGPYLTSKMVPLAVIGAVQAALLLGTARVIQGAEGSTRDQFLILALASWNAIALGLIISALATNADKASAIVPAAMLPQIVFGGLLVALPAMKPLARGLAELAVAKWANQAMEVALLEGRVVTPELVARPEYTIALWNLYPEYDFREESGRRRFLQDRAGEPVRKSALLSADYGALSAFIAVQLAIAAGLLQRQDGSLRKAWSENSRRKRPT